MLVLLAGASSARAADATSPLVLSAGVGLFDQFGYAPAYTRNVPAFDAAGRAYIRSRTSSESATSYVHTLDAGAWVRLDFLTSLREAYPGFVSTAGAGGLRSDRIVFDRQDRAYNPLTVRLRDGTTRNALLVSWDHCRSWKVFPLPQGTFAVEHWVGHNEIDGPPFLAVWRTSGPPDVPGSQRNLLLVTQPRLDGDQLVIPPPVPVTDRCLGLSRDSGGASFAVTRGEQTWFVWSEVAPERTGGTAHFVATYDHVTGTVSTPRELVKSPRKSDPHNKPGICVDGAGYLHVIAGGHGSPALYTRSLAPLTADSGWTTPVPVLSGGWAETPDPLVQQGRQTYPAFVCDSKDTLHLITRQWRRGVDPYHAGKGYGALVHQWCPAGGTWSEPSLIVVGAYPGYSVFFHKVALDARDRLFLSCSYQGGPELRQERSLDEALAVLGRSQVRPGKYRSRMLLVSDDAGATWRFASDTDLEPAAGALAAAPRAGRSAAGPRSGRTAVEPPVLSWRWLNPQSHGNQFTAIAFSGKFAGWAVGTHGTLGRTSDGVHWYTQTAPTVADLYGVAAASAQRAWAVGADGTILRTTDGGTTWSAQASGSDRDLFGVCAVSPRDVWAVGERGIVLHTVDGGRTWAPRPSPSSETLFDITFADRRRGLICGGRGLLLRTRDGGRRWQRRRSLTSRALYAVDLLDDGRAAAAGEDGLVVYSGNGGWTWSQSRTRTKETIRAVRLLPSGRAWALGPATVLRSGNGGRSWRSTPLPVPGPCGALAAATDRHVFVGGAGGALCRSSDGGKTWWLLGSGHRSALTEIDAEGDAVWLAGAGGTFVRVDRTSGEWALQTLASGEDLRGLARIGARGWVVGDDGAIAATSDAGATWTGIPSPTREDLRAVAAPTDQQVIVAGDAGALMTSTDAGNTWTPAATIADDLLCLAFADGQTGWAGGGGGFGETRAEVLHTTDGGLTWRATDLPVWGRVRDLWFIDAQVGWAAVEDWGIDGDRPQGAILATADGGNTWARQTTTAAVLLGVRVAADGSGWACGERGTVLQTADAGQTWVPRDVGTDSAIHAVASPGLGEVWLTGADGAVLAGAAAPL
jgi:photosystem II stability/assembly factor-like uncharacterized protein